MGGRPGTAITGHVDLVHPTKYVKAADLRGKDVTIVITGITWEALVMAGGKKDIKPAVRMSSVSGKPLEKMWIVGKTVMKQIAQTVGEKNVERWIGKRVTMYPTTCRGQGGQEMECIRVRVRVNATATEITEDMAATPEPAPSFLDEAGDDSAREPGSDG